MSVNQVILQHDGHGFFVRFPAPCRERELCRAAGFRFSDGRWNAPSAAAAIKLAQQSGVEVTETASRLLKVAIDAAAERAKAENANREASRATDAAIEIPAPAGLAYLPYQKAGIAYLMGKTSTLVGDEMGLGKTIQAIGLINADPSIRRVLVICPASLKLNWFRELQKWLVEPRTIAILQRGQSIPQADIAIVNYDIIGKLRAIIDSVDWDLMICDESHYLKNPKAARTKQVLGQGREGFAPIAAKRRVFLTGTPVLNRPIELWSIVHALDPHGLGRSFMRFTMRYCAAHQNRFGWDFSGASNLDELQDRLRSSIMIRRLKRDVLTELPAKRRQLVPIEASGALGKVSYAMDVAFTKSEAEIARLQADAELAKAESETAYKVAVNSLRNRQRAAFQELSKLRHELALSKVPAVTEHVQELLETVEKVVVFCHHRDVAAQLASGGAGVVLVHGDMPIAERQAAVDRFQTDPTCRLFVGTIMAAGVGLTLTAASTVVFAELDWVPGNVSQAEDRCHRIGQRDTVLVQHLVVDGSLDARLAQTLVDKQAVLDAALDDPTGRATFMAEEMMDFESLTIVDDDVAEAVEREAAEREALRQADREARRRAAEARQEAAQQRAGESTADRKVSQRAATLRISRDVLVREGEAMSAMQQQAARSAVRYLAMLDPDGAQVLNGVGFSKADVYLGHTLSALAEPAPAHWAMMRRLALRYPRQVPTEVAVLKGEIA